MAEKRRAAKARPKALEADFEGTCRLEIPDSPTPPPRKDYPLRCRILFSASRDTVTLREFAPIDTGPYEARLGPMTITNSTMVHVKSAETGRLSRDGHFAIEVLLHFDHSFDAPFYEEDSDVRITLSTRGDGAAALGDDGSVRLVGTGRFEGGALDGKRCHLTYAGRADPRPW